MSLIPLEIPLPSFRHPNEPGNSDRHLYIPIYLSSGNLRTPSREFQILPNKKI